MLIRFNGSLFLPLVLIEFAIAYFYVVSYGFMSFLVEILLSAVLGLFFIANAGFGNVRDQIFNITPSKIFGAIGLGIGGFLLLMPGILSDIFGLVIAIALFFFKQKADESRKFTNETNFRYTNDEVIDVEVVDEPNSIR